MDWFVPNDTEAVTALRHEVRAYLERHAAPGSGIAEAELAFSELATNAVVHTDGDVWVSIEWDSPHPVVTIHDVGPGFEFDPGAPPDTVPAGRIGGRGLRIASHLTRQLEVAAKRAGGSRVTAVLDVERKPEADLDADPRAPVPPLAGDLVDGYYTPELFLRSLVVGLARAVESRHGPAAAQAAIAQVGADIGNRMELEHRERAGITDALSPTAMAEFFVRLKAEIGGDFYVIEVADDRVVLGNDKCPFGEAVRRSPSLCRMTSAVFGGVAARNLGRDVAVHLEERIAVGDPGCRVTVWLDDPPEEVAVFVHRYRGR